MQLDKEQVDKAFDKFNKKYSPAKISEIKKLKEEESQILKAQINQTDKEIDQMIYQLYELTDEEIKIVEESVN